MAELTDQEFRVRADDAIEDAQKALLPLADAQNFEVELQNGVLQVIFEEPKPSKFVVSPNAPVQQIWVSALSRSFKLSWVSEAEGFALDAERLPALLERVTRTHLGL
jgi:CyaY protein